MAYETQQPGEIYHEKQRLQFCLLHALNNLLQDGEAFSKEELDSIANELTDIYPNTEWWKQFTVVWKPHHNSLTGNYDINVLFTALQRKGKKVFWYDKRNSLEFLGFKNGEEKLVGIILNKCVKKFHGLWKSRHWIALRQIDGIWYNLDSDLPSPLAFDEKCQDDLKQFLEQNLVNGGEILLVFEGDSEIS